MTPIIPALAGLLLLVSSLLFGDSHALAVLGGSGLALIFVAYVESQS